MKERAEKKIALGLIRKSSAVVEEIERTAEKMTREGWCFLHSETDIDLKTISLFFEREMRD